MEGQPTPFSDESLARISDVAEIRKIYKLGASNAKPGEVNVQASDSEREEMEIAILGAMALRGAS